MPDQLSQDLASLRIDRTARPPANRGWLYSLIALGLLLAAGAWGMGELSSRVFKTSVEVSELRMVSPAQAAIQVTSTGYIMPQRTARVGAKVLGRVAEVFVAEGDPVTAGTLLLRLEGTEPRASASAARARNLAARARHSSAVAAVAEAKRAWERERELAAKDASTRARAEDLQLRLSVLEATAHAALADADAAAAELAVVSTNLGNTEIYAPIDGVIMARPPTVGELMGPGTTAVVEVADFSSLMVETDVPESKVALVKKGGPTEIVLDAFPTVRHRGAVAEVSPRVNRAKATVIVKVAFADPVADLLPDMSARVSFLSEALGDGAQAEPPKLFVPGGAVVERGGQKVVFRVQDGKAVSTPITLGPPMAGGFGVAGGPAVGAKVIMNPPAEIEDGYPVKEGTE